jgi:hypothetical protein
MNITLGQSYKVVEFDKGVILLDSKDDLKRPDTWPLIIGNGETCAEYLLRYLRARENGKSIPLAHQQAIVGAQVVAAGHLDAPQ